jgi:hypothetical protein
MRSEWERQTRARQREERAAAAAAEGRPYTENEERMFQLEQEARHAAAAERRQQAWNTLGRNILAQIDQSVPGESEYEQLRRIKNAKAKLNIVRTFQP